MKVLFYYWPRGNQLENLHNNLKVIYNGQMQMNNFAFYKLLSSNDGSARILKVVFFFCLQNFKHFFLCKKMLLLISSTL